MHQETGLGHLRYNIMFSPVSTPVLYVSLPSETLDPLFREH